MNIATNNQETRIQDLQVTEETITALLVDGRSISVPLAWSWRLSEATPEQRSNYELIGDGLNPALKCFSKMTSDEWG